MGNLKVRLVFCVLLLLLSAVSSLGKQTEEEKQSAFEQLIATGNRLRWLARSSSSADHETAVGPPTSANVDLLAKDEPAKRHDRRHANSSTGEKKNKKEHHAKRQHRPGLVKRELLGRVLLCLRNTRSKSQLVVSIHGQLLRVPCF